MTRKFMVYSPWLMVVIFLLSITYHPPPTISATTATPSAKQVATSTSLTDKLNALKQEVASKAAQLKLEVDRKTQNKAVFGRLVNKSDDLLTVTKIASASANLTREVRINEYTDYRQGLKAGKKIALAQLTNNDLLIALGDVDDKGVLTAKRVYKLDKATFPESPMFWGQIQSVSGSTIVLKTKDQGQVKLDSSATLWQLGNQQASRLDAKVGRFLVSVGNPARFIYLIPQPGFFKPDKPRPATSSATPALQQSEPSTSPKK